MRGTLGMAAVLAVIACAAVAPVMAGERYTIRESDNRRDFGWMLSEGGGNSAAMDLDDVERLQDRLHGQFLYVRIDGQGWVMRDGRTLDRAREIVRPMRELGAQARELAQAYRGTMVDERAIRAMARAQAQMARREALMQVRQERMQRLRDGDRDGSEDDSRAEMRAELEQARAELARAREELRQADGGRSFDDRPGYSTSRRELEQRKEQLKADRHEKMRDINRQLEDLTRDAIRHDRAERVDW